MYVQYSLRCFFHMLFYFFFNDTATTEIYTLSLHDALPISGGRAGLESVRRRRYDLVVSDVRMPEGGGEEFYRSAVALEIGRSTRLNSSHGYISYAVFCLKKKKPNRLLRPLLRARTPGSQRR